MFIIYSNILFYKMPIQITCPFFQWVCLLFSYAIIEVIYIFWMQVPCYVLQISHPLCSLPFNSLSDIFDEQKFLIPMKSNLSLFPYDYMFAFLF